MFHPVATQECCTAALLLDIDPIGLVRGRRPAEVANIGQYVNDRPYAASSFTSVAIAQVFDSALNSKRSRASSSASRSTECTNASSACWALESEPVDPRL